MLIFIFHEEYGSNYRYWLGTEESSSFESLDYLGNSLGKRISYFFYFLFYDMIFFFIFLYDFLIFLGFCFFFFLILFFILLRYFL
jgi:hypothetical protein